MFTMEIWKLNKVMIKIRIYKYGCNIETKENLRLYDYIYLKIKIWFLAIPSLITLITFLFFLQYNKILIYKQWDLIEINL